MHNKEAYPVLRKMMDDFDSWFPFDGTEDEEEKEMYREMRISYVFDIFSDLGDL